MSEGSFLDQVMAGGRRLEEIDDFVKAWHEGSGAGDLRQVLGMTPDEYALWLRAPDKLDAICTARRNHQALADT